MDKTTKTTTPNPTHKKSPDLLPYMIVFAILTIAAIGALTWTIGIWYKSNQCAINPNIWCFDTWQCNENCTTQLPYDTQNCFGRATDGTGLASCLYGPTSAIATTCLAINAPTGGTGTACPCALSGPTGTSCLAGCAGDFSGLTGGDTCCCCPGQGTCPTGYVPPDQCGTNGKCQTNNT